MPRPDLDPYLAEFRRRVSAWRAALRGVPSPEPPSPPAPPDMMPAPPYSPQATMSPAAQASYDLRRPLAQIPQPLVVGGVLAAYPSLLALIASPFAGVGTFVVLMGLTGLFTARRYRKQLRAAAGRVLNSAFNLIGLGRLREAAEVLAVIEALVKEPWALRLVDIQMATIAIRRGDLAVAEARLTAALERPIGGFARDNALYQLEGARALRAFVLASLGKHEQARADIDAVKGGGASQDALARVALAEAMLLEQQGKREELRLLLTEKSALLLEHTHPRERAIVRAFQRMVRSDKSSVYRRAESRREPTEREEPMLADWVAKVAPGAAAFVRSSRHADQAAKVAPADVVARPSEAAVRANTEAKKPAKSGAFKWILAGVAGTAVAATAAGAAIEASSVSTGAAGATTAAAAAGGVNTAGLVMLLLLAFGVIYLIARGLRWVARVRAERAARAAPGPSRGAPDEAQLRDLTKSPSPTVAAQAWLLLADRAEKRADFAGALEASTNGLKCLADPRDRAAADIVYPDLLSLRAFALSAHGRGHEANAELASLGPGYPHFSRAVFRARLLVLLRSGDLRYAAQWVDQGEADLPLSVREELLADLVRATVSPEAAGAGEIQRIKDELASTPEIKAWLRAAAPGLLDAFEGATETEVRMRFDEGLERDARAEGEAHAEAEAAAALEGAAGARLAPST